MLGIHRDLDVVADADAAAGMHRPRVLVGQRDLILTALGEGLAVLFQLCAPVPDRRDLLL